MHELRGILEQPRLIKTIALPLALCSQHAIVLPCIAMASLHHHFGFVPLKPLSFTWHCLNLMKGSTRAGKGHIFFAGKSPCACTEAESRPKSGSQQQPRNIQQHMGQVTNMHCRHLLPLHGEAKPENIRVWRPQGNDEQPWGNAREEFLGSWGRRGGLLCSSHTGQLPQNGLENGAFWVSVLLVSSDKADPNASHSAHPRTKNCVCCWVLTPVCL